MDGGRWAVGGEDTRYSGSLADVDVLFEAQLRGQLLLPGNRWLQQYHGRLGDGELLPEQNRLRRQSLDLIPNEAQGLSQASLDARRRKETLD